MEYPEHGVQLELFGPEIPVHSHQPALAHLNFIETMELFIRIKDGQSFEHPILGENLRQAFPEIDVNNLPPEFARFERVERPILSEYEILVLEEPTYELVDGVYKDVWHKREMTLEEKEIVEQNKIKLFKDSWANQPQAKNWEAWVFNEEMVKYEPPIPRPEPDETKINQNIFTFWCGADNNWKDTPIRPDGKYKFDFFAWQWVEIVDKTPDE
jgi:hypothetical protein